MTMTEKKKLRFQIANLQRTKPCNVYIDRTERIGEKQCKIHATVKGYKVGVLIDGDHIISSWRVVS